jgi:DNA polymerase-3 subunit gamma/tau
MGAPANNGEAKKKAVAKSQAFRSVPIRSFTSQPVKAFTKEEEAKIMVETAAPQMPKPETVPAQDVPDKSKGKLSALDKIRKQYQPDGSKGNGPVNRPLDPDELKQAWDEYVVLLKEKKNPAAQPFELALLRIRDANSFEAVTHNPVERQFIEQDRNKLFAFLQERLQNRLLQFNVIIEGNAADRPKMEVTMSASEQYQKMIELYPQVKELKERLGLTLDY